MLQALRKLRFTTLADFVLFLAAQLSEDERKDLTRFMYECGAATGRIPELAHWASDTQLDDQGLLVPKAAALPSAALQVCPGCHCDDALHAAPLLSTATASSSSGLTSAHAAGCQHIVYFTELSLAKLLNLHNCCALCCCCCSLICLRTQLAAATQQPSRLLQHLQ